MLDTSKWSSEDQSYLFQIQLVQGLHKKYSKECDTDKYKFDKWLMAEVIRLQLKNRKK